MPVDEEKWNVLEVVGRAPSPRGDIIVEVAAYDTMPFAVYLSRARKEEGHKKLGGISAADITGLLPLLEKGAEALTRLASEGKGEKAASAEAPVVKVKAAKKPAAGKT